MEITINPEKPATDAFFIPKDEAARNFADVRGLALNRVAAIGDSKKDICWVANPEYGLAGAVANADQELKDAVGANQNGAVTFHPVYDGFLQFFRYAKMKGITHLITDKDGVLKDGNASYHDQFRRDVGARMGNDGFPLVAVLTGSSYAQNASFMRKYGFDASLASNLAVQADPFLILCENGQIEINVLDGSVRNHVGRMDPEALALLKGPFEQQVLSDVERLFPEFGLAWSAVYEQQDGLVYAPSKHLEKRGIVGDAPKESMVTINVPRTVRGQEWRSTPESKRFRDAVRDSMIRAAENCGMPYRVL